MPSPASPQGLNRHSYAENRPLGDTDPGGCLPCGRACPGDWTSWQIGFGSAYGGEWNPVEQAENRGRAAQAAGLVVDLGPSAGDLKGVIEVFTGRDLITGEDLGDWRWAGLFGLAGLAEVRYLRYGDEAGDVLRLLSKGGDLGGATGQWHHILSNKVMRALGEHVSLRGALERADLLAPASDLTSHRGYEAWHRPYDDEVVACLADPANAEATQREFLELLLGIYGRPEMRERFSGAVDLLSQALEALE